MVDFSKYLEKEFALCETSDLEDGSSSFFDQVPVPAPDAPPVAPPVQLDWTEEQRAAIEQVVSWRMDPYAPRFMKLSGAAGTGKTTVMGEIRRRLFGTRTAWSGMTGKAALRLRAMIGAATRTSHSALYHPPREVDNPKEAKIDLEFDHVRSDGSEGMLLTIDESSMVGPKFRADLDRSSYSKVLLIGDPFQLSPVLSKAEEAAIGGEDYSVFRDIEGPHLTKVMRNAGAVLAAATVVREKQQIPTDSGEFGGSRYDYVACSSPNQVIACAVENWLESQQDHVLLTWRNEVRVACNTIIRQRLGYTSALPVVGEPLVVRKNIHKKSLMNGDVVRCVEIGEEGPTLAGIPTRWFRLRDEITGRTPHVLCAAGDFSGILPYVGLATWKQALREARVDDVVPLTFAYALTAHLAQGSQYSRVSVMIPGDFRSPHFNKMTTLPDGTPMAMCWRWVYTAVSRAVSRASLLISR